MLLLGYSQHVGQQKGRRVGRRPAGDLDL